ncbi:ATP-grasp domain-containing protein [Candidatus Marithrix sp. Canyon 246]|uniref:ATP-grasp domain-containing protein n=1 Tax=Candidatus Marithrix sp. Canyon 246 TaxID=1827136 RepID=UPI00084A0E58|nr:ATP-grasp domain-containing protein [Candidatus Marithrix sp. Canyon 246]
MSKRIAIIHSYPSNYLFDVLIKKGYKIVYFGPKSNVVELSKIESAVEIPIHDFEQSLEIIHNYHKKRPIDIILPIYEGATILTAKIAHALSLKGTTVEAAEASRNKYLAYQKWSKQDVPVPKTVPILDEATGWEAIQKYIGLPAVIKLTDSMNSQGVIKVDDHKSYSLALKQLNTLLSRPLHYNSALDRNRIAYGKSKVSFMAQSFCKGVEVGVDLIITKGKTLVTGIYEKAASAGPYFIETMSVSPTSLGKKVEHELAEIATQAVAAIGHKLGVAHVEIRYADDGPKVLEAGLRPGGAYTVMAIEYLMGINTYTALADILSGGELPEPISNGRAALYGGIVYHKSGYIKSVNGLEFLTGLSGLLDVIYLNKVGDYVVTAPEAAQPHFAYYLLQDSSRENVLQSHAYIQEKVKLNIA